MRVVVFLGLFLLWGSGAWAEEHQRIASTVEVPHRWDIDADASVTPLGLSGWELDWAARVGYEWEKTWSLGLSLPGNLKDWGDLALDVGWSGGGTDLRWNWEGGLEAGGGSSSIGLQLVQDPVILGLSAGLSWAIGTDQIGGHGSLSFQEVLNDTTTWSLTLAPRMFWVESFPVWTLNVVWTVGWYQGPASFSTGVAAGSLAPWSLSTSAGWSWETGAKR